MTTVGQRQAAKKPNKDPLDGVIQNVLMGAADAGMAALAMVAVNQDFGLHLGFLGYWWLVLIANGLARLFYTDNRL